MYINQIIGQVFINILGYDMLKIALINPPYRVTRHTLSPTYPMGLGYIKAVCECNNVHCDLYDFAATDKSDDELIVHYNLKRYDIIGISSYSLFFSDTAVFIDKLKTSENTIIVGGHHATLCKDRLLEDFPNIDFSLIGFGEYSFLHLVKNFRTDELYNTPGLCFRCEGKIIVNSTNYSNFDLNKIPYPDRTDIIVDYNRDKTIDVSKVVLSISTSRGCPYHCTYCVNCKNNYWLTRSVENVLNELKKEFSYNQYKRINFVDCNFYIDPDRAENIIYSIKSEFPDVTFSFQTRADQIVANESRLIELLKSVECNIDVGIESNSNEVLKRYKKETNEAINQKAIDILKQADCSIVAYIIMFEALETLSDIRKTFNFLKKNKLFQYNNINNLYQTLLPFYGSAYYDEYHDYYYGSIHERAYPKFVHSNVESFYKVMVNFRNEFEDIIEEVIFQISKLEDLSNETRQDFIFLSKVAYIVFEYYLIMCEDFDKCYEKEFKKSKIYNMLNETIDKYKSEK